MFVQCLICYNKKGGRLNIDILSNHDVFRFGSGHLFTIPKLKESWLNKSNYLMQKKRDFIPIFTFSKLKELWQTNQNGF